MERFVKGDVVVVPFPFTDFTSSERRPALVLCQDKDDIILCSITTKKREDTKDVFITHKDFSEGSLRVESFVRLTRLLTVSKSLILYKIGSLKQEKIEEIANEVCKMLKDY